MPSMSMPDYPPAEAIALFYRAILVVGVFLALVLLAFAGTRRPRAGAGRPPAASGAGTPELLAFGLGVLWLLDGLLQAQPLMVTRFLGGLLAPLIAGQPAPVVALVRLGMRLWGLNPIWMNVGVTYLQVGIGVALLFARSERVRRAALVVSAAWAGVVWVFGEAFGSLFHGGGPLVGTPGSALLYAVVSLLLLRPAAFWEGEAARRALRCLFAGVFLLEAFLALLPADGWWGGGLAAYFAAMAAMPQPATLAALQGALGSLAVHAGALENAVVAGACLALGVLFALRPLSRPLLWAAAAWTFLVWALGQDFGVLGGMATDPNTGAVLLVLELVAVRLTPRPVPAPRLRPVRRAAGEAS